MAETFVNMLIDMRGGAVAAQLSASWTEVVAQVARTGKPGKFTLELKVTPLAGDNGVTQLEVTPTAKSTMPQPSLGKSIFFGTEEGDLTRHDPRQEDLFEGEPKNARR